MLKKMARFCIRCGTRLTFLQSLFRQKYCSSCKEAIQLELRKQKEEAEKIESSVLLARNIDLSDEQIELLRKQSLSFRLNMFMKFYRILNEDKEITFEEYNQLKKAQDILELTNEEINFDDNIRPFLYVLMIKHEGTLPIIETPEIEGSRVVLQPNEKIHFYFPTTLKEKRIITTRYGGSSQGISFNIAKGVRYRIGSHRGNIVREEALVETSKGILIITNQRILLHPFMGYQLLSIQLKKILSYQCFSDCLLVFKEGREKGFYFFAVKSGWVEVAGICLSFLLEN